MGWRMFRRWCRRGPSISGQACRSARCAEQMNIVQFAVHRPQFTILALTTLFAIGGVSLFAIPKGEDPTFPYADFIVPLIYPGTPPEELETLVVDPVEA